MNRIALLRTLGPHETVVRSARGRWSFRVRHRPLWVTVALILSLLFLLVAALLVGDFRVTPSALFATLSGDAPDSQTEFFVLGRRLPRALLAMSIGAALALSGAIFQSITRNPLASPDVIGVSSGASLGAVLILLVFGGSLDQAALGAVLGALLAAGLILLLSSRRGLHGVQLVLTGVGIAAVAMAIVDYVLSQVFIASATTAQTWLVGSLQGRSWSSLPPVLLALGVIIPLLWWKAADLRTLSLGDGIATGLGVRAVEARWVLLGSATLLVAVAVGAAGPIAFVALVAPHIARSLSGGLSLLNAGLVGATLLTASDLIGLYAFPAPIPVGAVTITLGGCFFLWLLWREGTQRG